MGLLQRPPLRGGLSRRVRELEAALARCEAAVARLDDELADARAQGRRIADIADVVVEELVARSDAPDVRARLQPPA